MSGQPNRNPTDPSKFRQQYLANLALEANINDKNLQANKIYKKTGEVPSQMTDNRTTAEKLADIERLKIDVRSELSEITDGENANAIARTELRRTTITIFSATYQRNNRRYKAKIQIRSSCCYFR